MTKLGIYLVTWICVCVTITTALPDVSIISQQSLQTLKAPKIITELYESETEFILRSVGQNF